MNSKEIKAYNLPAEEKSLYRMETKPYVLLISLLIIGLVMFMINGTLAMIICAISVYAILLLPSKTLLDFKESYLVMNNRASKNDCMMIYYDEIVSWCYAKGSKEDELIIELIDGSKEKIECFNRLKVKQILNQCAPYKELIIKKSK